jgi:adenosylcobinamide kinase/adenosylcobinamide-phosphate guanylyltransferase
LGGARSGKSAWAERAARESGRPVLYLATATAIDDEMTERIAAHRAARPVEWRTVEAPLDLAAALRAQARPGDLVLVDCLTVWTSNAILERLGGSAADDLPAAAWRTIEAEVLAAARDLLRAAKSAEVALILISNEVGMGVVPPFPLGRRYRDVLGRVNQAVASEADKVILMIAGLPIDLRRLALLQGH